METNKLISIIIPSYNPDAALLKRALRSIINQNYRPIEIIISDDGSQNDLHNEIDFFSSKYSSALLKIKFVKSHKNLGISFARNAAVSEAKGSWLVWLDTDDELGDGCINELVSAAKDNKMIIGDCYVYESGVVSRRKPGIYLKAAQKFIKTANDPFLLNIISVQPQLVSKQAFIETGMFDVNFRFAELTDFFLRFLVKNGVESIGYTEKASYHYYRGRPDSLSAQREQLMIHRLLALKNYMSAQKIPGQNLMYVGRNAMTGMQQYELVQND